MRKGLFRFTIGDESNLVEWVYIDNLVHAHILACCLLEKELKGKIAKVSGMGFPISDHHPINQFKFLEYLQSALNFPKPFINIPYKMMYFFAYLIEVFYSFTKHLIDYEPFMSRAEVNKVGVEHYFDSEQVVKKLGYRPIVSFEEAIKKTVTFYKNEEEKRLKNKRKTFHTPAALLVILTIFLLLIVYFFSSLY